MIIPILLLGLILRLINLNQSLWLDEAINVIATKNFSFLGMITEYAKGDFHPPGYFIILWIWAHIFGNNEIVIRIPSVVFGVLTVYAVFIVGQKLHSKTIGLISALILAVNPLHIYYSQEARMYAFSTLMVCLNFFLFLKLIKGEKVHVLFLILSNLGVLAADYLAYFIFPAQFVCLTFLQQKKICKRWLVSLAVAILFGVWWIPVFLSQLKVGLFAVDKIPTWKLAVGGFDAKALPLTLVKFIIGRISYPDRFIYSLILLPIVTLFLLLLIQAVKSVNSYKRVILLCWLLIPLSLGGTISLVLPIYSYFRVIFILPAFIILISLGIISFKRRKAFLAVVLLIEIISSAVYLFNPSYQRENWKGLVNFLKSQNRQKLILFESPGVISSFDYYAQNSLNAKGALKDLPANNIEQIIDIPNAKDIYLVDYLVEISDPKRLVDRKLVKLGYEKIDTIDFRGVGFVYHYIHE